jgi:hypothetical protein
MSTERAGVHTGSTLNRGMAFQVAHIYSKSWLQGLTKEEIVRAFEACVIPDPRIARIEAALAETETMTLNPGAARVLDIVGQIIRGEV